MATILKVNFTKIVTMNQSADVVMTIKGMTNLKWISDGMATHEGIIHPRPSWIPLQTGVIKMSQHEKRIVPL